MKNLTKVSVFELELGQRVYDIFKDRYGKISSIKETDPEVVEAFVSWDDTPDKEEKATYMPNIALVTE